MESKLTFKIKRTPENHGVHLDNFSPSDAKSLLTILDAFAKIIENTPNSNLKLAIKEGCIETAIVGEENDIALLETQLEEVKQGNCEQETIVGAWRQIQETIKANGYDYAFGKENNGQMDESWLEDFKIRSRFTKKRKKYTPTVTTLFVKGKVTTIGGKIPNFHLEVENQLEFIIACNEDQAKQVGNYLYDSSGIMIAVWKVEKTDTSSNDTDNKIFEYSFCDIYQTKEQFDRYKNMYQDYLDKLPSEVDYLFYLMENTIDILDSEVHNAPEKLNRFIKLFCHPCYPKTIFKAFTFDTSHLAEDPILKDTLQKIKELYQAKSR